jgi:DNA repair exonuclease SbcCD ATPase subunit
MREQKLESPLELAAALRKERAATALKLESLRARAAERDATATGRALRLLEREPLADTERELQHFEQRLHEIDSTISELHEHELRAKHEAANAAWVGALPEICLRRREAEQAAQALVDALESCDRALAGALRAGASGVAPSVTHFAGRDASGLRDALAAFRTQTDQWLAATEAGTKTVTVKMLSDRPNVGERGATVQLSVREALALRAVGAAEPDAKGIEAWRAAAAAPGRGSRNP